MAFARAAGILLHPTSLPGYGGMGSLGGEALDFLNTLHRSGMRLWQVLPLGPTGYGDSPYSALSAFAGNPLLISLQRLQSEGLLGEEDLESLADMPETHVDFGRIIPLKMAALRRSFEQFGEQRESEVGRFRHENRDWLEDFALFMAIKDSYGGAPWYQWDMPLRQREQGALTAARERLGADIDFHCYIQWLFLRQWEDVKRYAGRRGIKIIGDIPIFVAHDSSDVWANQRLFQLDEEGTPSVVAGVPPDYFSATGQLWGNPHYRWDVMAQEGFGWWIARFRTLLRLVDIVRLDHFRGFAASWAVPYGDDTAVRGRWVPSPGNELFSALQSALGDAPIIAEDLGVITPDVEELRDRFHFPGMHILQFAFGSGAWGTSLPHNFVRNSVVYTGTHDNDTTVGWFGSITEGERAFITRYIGTQGVDIAWDLLRVALASTAVFAIAPMQDVLRLGTGARMNFPGRPQGNWSWRYTDGSVTEEHVRNLHLLASTYGRLQSGSEGPAAIDSTV